MKRRVALAAVALACGGCVTSSSQTSTTSVLTTTTVRATATTTIDYEKVCRPFARAWTAETNRIRSVRVYWDGIILQIEMGQQILGEFHPSAEGWFEDFAKLYRETAIDIRDEAFGAPGLVPEAYQDLAEVYHLYGDAGLLGAAAGAEKSQDLLKEAERKFLDAEIAWTGIDWRCDPTP